MLEVDSERGRFSLGLKDSYFVGEGGVEDEVALAPGRDSEQPDLDDQLLDVMEADSDDGGDWRNAAAVGGDTDARGGKLSRSTHSAEELAHYFRPQRLDMPWQSQYTAITGYSCQLHGSSPCRRLTYRPHEHSRLCLKKALNSVDPSFTIWSDHSA